MDVSSTMPIIGWNRISVDDNPLARVNSTNIPHSDDITNFEPDDHPSPWESVNINLYTTELTHIVFSVVDIPLNDSS